MQEENQFNDPPPAGFRDVIVRLRAQNVGGSAATETGVSDSDFKFVGSLGVLYSTFQQSCGVIPDELDADLFLGGIAEGNVCIQIPVEESDLIMVYEQFFSFDDDDRLWLAVRSSL